MGLKKNPGYPAVGDKVTMVVHPLRDGRTGGSFVSITLPDGRTLHTAPPGAGGPAPAPAR